MRTSAIAVNNFKLGQPHVVHRLSAAWSTDLGECDNVAPLTHDLRKASMNPMAISRTDCRAYAERCSWRRCAEQFLRPLVPLRS